jgi:uncharacterized protein YyaL (SSP411 family)
MHRYRSVIVPKFLVLLLLPACGGRCGGSPGHAGGGEAVQEPSLPGIAQPSAVLDAQLRDALRSKGPTYVPRSRHVGSDGSPQFINRLILETSPYLLQHAHNPVDWYAWGDAPFAKALREGKPVLVSIGYSTCHWCHVMEQESFEDEEIARYLNENYVCVKVDREERPDVDEAYMAAVHRLGLGGGWPLNVWLTPNRKPFFGGTYFPPRDGDRGARKGFLSILKELRAKFTATPGEVAAQADALARDIRTDLEGETGQGLPGTADLAAAESFFTSRFDAENGGLTGAPKFPSSLPVRLMLRLWRRTGNPKGLQMAALTLESMAAGGIYDQIGGGFHRYSTDARWRTPHFEKMLYDNALLAIAYAEAFQATHRPEFARVLRETLGFLEREMASPRGGFYSAMDADSPGGEGAFYTWTAEQIRSMLGDGADAFSTFYGVEAGPSVLFVPAPDERRGEAFAGARRLLRDVRRRRPAPAKDEKIVAAWNGYAISAFAVAGRVLGDRHLTDVAERTAEFAHNHLVRDAVVRRVDDHVGFLEDGAALIQGFIDLFEATGEPRWLDEAMGIQRRLDSDFADPVRGGYYRTAAGGEVVLGRERPSQDGPEPSGNSLEALNLLRLTELTGRREYRQSAEMLLRGFGQELAAAPAALSDMLLAVDFWADRSKEIAIVLPDADASEPLLQMRLRAHFLPNDVQWVGSESQVGATAKTAAWLEGKHCLKGLPTAYVCTEGVCDLPTHLPDVLDRELASGRESKSVTPAAEGR